MSTLPEILFDVPGTAHCIGGCVIADSPQHGVIDDQHRVFNYQNMYICDGSVVAANLGVNPSLTITALAERAMTFIPRRAEAGWNNTDSVFELSARAHCGRLIVKRKTRQSLNAWNAAYGPSISSRRIWNVSATLAGDESHVGNDIAESGRQGWAYGPAIRFDGTHHLTPANHFCL